MPDVVELETLEGAVENVEGDGEDVQLWRASIGETSAIGENRAAALRELAAELDKKAVRLSVGQEAVEQTVEQAIDDANRDARASGGDAL